PGPSSTVGDGTPPLLLPRHRAYLEGATGDGEEGRPVVATRDELGGRLPRAPSPLIGRDEIVDELTRDVIGRHRLVTLTGPGGAGKTRVAVAVAEACGPRLEDGSRFVPLAGLNDPSELPE